MSKALRIVSNQAIVIDRTPKISHHILVLCCQFSDPQQAKIIRMLYTDALQPPNQEPNLDSIRFNPGTVNATKIRFNAANNTLSGTVHIHGEVISSALRHAYHTVSIILLAIRLLSAVTS